MLVKPEFGIKVPARDFSIHERLLWHTLKRLARQGYVVPPDEGRDLIHDFYVEAWEGLEQRYAAESGPFSSYVSGAFYRFARRRLIEWQLWRSKLVDLDAIVERSTDLPSPLEEAELAEQVELIRRALATLPGPQRQVLIDYAVHPNASERDIASRQGRTRHAIRRLLAEGISNLGVRLQTLGVANARVAELAWHEGRVSADIANQTSLSTSQVKEARKLLAEKLNAALKASSSTSKKRDLS